MRKREVSLYILSRFKCHKKCSRKAPPSCGLPPALEKIFIDTLRSSDGNGELRSSIVFTASTKYNANNMVVTDLMLKLAPSFPFKVIFLFL